MRSLASLVFAFAAALLVGASAAAPAQAQIMTNFSWTPPAKVQEAMEKEQKPGIFAFVVPGEPAAGSIDWNFTQPAVVDQLKKCDYVACKISITDAKSTKPWGSYQKLADEFGVTGQTTLVIVAFDRTVLAVLSQTLKRDEFIPYLGQKAKENKARIADTEQAANDISQIEKWLEEKKLKDAARRLKSVMDKSKRVTPAMQQKIKDTEKALEAKGKEMVDQAKALIDAGKGSDAKALLEQVSVGCAKYEVGKEATELMKKAK